MAARISSDVRQSWIVNSHAASGDMVIGAMPKPAETSDTARLRWVSNQPVTQAIIGAKMAAVARAHEEAEDELELEERRRPAGERQGSPPA